MSTIDSHIQKAHKELLVDSKIAKQALESLSQNRFSSATINHFGLGVLAEGKNSGRIIIPYPHQNRRGHLGYASRAIYTSAACQACNKIVTAHEMAKRQSKAPIEKIAKDTHWPKAEELLLAKQFAMRLYGDLDNEEHERLILNPLRNILQYAGTRVSLVQTALQITIENQIILQAKNNDLNSWVKYARNQLDLLLQSSEKSDEDIVKEKTDLVIYFINECDVELIQDGATSWVGNCPFHDDQNASLKVKETAEGLKIWHCHTDCQMGGTIIEAVKRKERNNSTLEAVKHLNAIYNLNLSVGLPDLSSDWKSCPRCKARASKAQLAWLVGQDPKYLTSKNLNTKNQLYHAMDQTEFGYLCEGYRDVWALYEAGIKNAAATCNAKLSMLQAQELIHSLPTNKSLIICPDLDDAGILSSVEAIKLLSKLDPTINIEIVHSYGNDSIKDPAEALKFYGADKLKTLIQTNHLDADTWLKLHSL